MSIEVLAVLFLIGFALVVGAIIANISNQRDLIHGGAPSKLFNFLGAALFAVILPTILVVIFVFHPQTTEIAGITFYPFMQIVSIAISLSLLSYCMMLIHAMFEHPAKEKSGDLDQGWTEEDARSSGL